MMNKRRTMNKKGYLTFWIMFFLIFSLLFVIFYGVFVYGVQKTNSILDLNVTIGQTNLAEVNSQTMGQLEDAVTTGGDTFGVMFILGQVLAMMGGAYIVSGGRMNKLWMIVDAGIMLFMFIFSVYISNIYQSYVTSGTGEFFDVYTQTLYKTSSLMLHLPWYVGIIGALIMIVTYVKLKDKKSVPNVFGY